MREWIETRVLRMGPTRATSIRLHLWIMRKAPELKRAVALGIAPLPLWERSTRVARRGEGWRQGARLLRKVGLSLGHS